MAVSVIVVTREVVNPAVLAELKRSQKLYANMLKRGLRVQTRAKRRLGANPKRIDTGRLRASISTAVVAENGTWTTKVGTNVEYAIYVHEGTRYMQANPFLRDALPAAKLGS